MCLAICNQKFWSFLLVLYNDFKDPGVLADSTSATLFAMVQCWETHIQHTLLPVIMTECIRDHAKFYNLLNCSSKGLKGKFCFLVSRELHHLVGTGDMSLVAADMIKQILLDLHPWIFLESNPKLVHTDMIHIHVLYSKELKYHIIEWELKIW